MDAKKLNPCEYETFAKAISWAETTCWCCSSVRAGLICLILGVGLGLVAGNHVVPAIWWLLVMLPLGAAALVWARKAWPDEEEKT